MLWSTARATSTCRRRRHPFSVAAAADEIRAVAAVVQGVGMTGVAVDGATGVVRVARGVDSEPLNSIPGGR